MASRSLLDLTPDVRAAALRLLETAGDEGLDVLIYCTLRSNAEQAELWASGRSKVGPRLTNAKPGESLHNPGPDGLARAFDAIPVVGGKLAWKDDKRILRMGQLGEAAGLEWAGRWQRDLRERVHFQMKG